MTSHTDKTTLISGAEMDNVVIVGDHYMQMDKETLVTIIVGLMTTEQLANKAAKLTKK